MFKKEGRNGPAFLGSVLYINKSDEGRCMDWKRAGAVLCKGGERAGKGVGRGSRRCEATQCWKEEGRNSREMRQ